MPRATLYESLAVASSAFSFVVDIQADVWATITDGTLPTVIPAVVVEAPAGGEAKALYDVLKVGRAILGPIRLVDPPTNPKNLSAVVPLKKGEKVAIQILGRSPEGR